jgi:stalled ribosome rescue protein Dom34
MSGYAGIWIDHREAVIVLLQADKEKSIVRIRSEAEGHYRLKGGAHSKSKIGSQDSMPENRREGRYKHHLQGYYKQIIDTVRDVESMIIFGPGEAKHELAKEIGREKALSGKIAAVETVDKMTEPQVVARVKKYFKSKE